MADEEDLKRLRDGERDLTRSDLRKASLQDLDLRDRDFSGVLFDGANLSNADLPGCNFGGATLTTARFDGANLSGVRFPQSIIHTSFKGANLAGANFSNCHLARVNLAGADIRGASFRSVTFMDDNDFSEVAFDSATDFDKATGLRYLSRLPAFQNYNYDRGIFTRKADASGVTDGADTFSATVEVRNPEPQSTAVIQKRIATSLPEVRGMASSLALAIDQHIQAIESEKPNEPDALSRYQSQVALLTDISNGLHSIAAALKDVDATAEGTTRASRIVADLSKKLETWMLQNGETLIGSTVNVGMIGVASSFFWMCGAYAPFGFAVATAVVGGKPVVDNVKELIKAWKDGPH